MKEIKIRIAGSEYQIKQSFRSLMLFEDMTGKPVSEANDSINTIMLMFYCILKACNKNFEYDFEQFVDVVDDNPESVEVFTNFLQDQAQPEPAKKKKNSLK